MSIKKTKHADVKYGSKNILKEQDFNQKNIGHRISIVIPEDVLMSLRENANEKKIGYQTLINQILREYVSDADCIEERIKRLEEIVLRKEA
jgi:predicted DNA binding CopG/RHH family protein